VHQGSTQTNKRLKLGFKYKGAKKLSVLWSGAPDNVRCTRTVQSPTSHSRVSSGALRYNSLDCPVHHRTVRCTSGVTTIQHNGRLQRLLTSATVRNSARQSQSAPDTEQCLFGVAPDSPMPLQDKASNGRQLPNPNGWVMWLAHWTVQCAHRQQPPPTACW
jgi:hypothetical protein